MPRYDTLLLDADGTLFDFKRAEQVAFTDTFRECGFPVDEDIAAMYSEINSEQWDKLERGEVTKGELVIRRFEITLQRLSIQADPREINRRYTRNLAKGNYLLPGAQEVCADLAPHCTLILATNGLAQVQRERLKSSAIAGYISDIVVSEDAGAAKPEEAFFRYAFQQCGIADKRKTLMVGDSLAADIAGGIRFGLDTCWYNPGGKTGGALTPTYTIPRITDLRNIVLDA